MHQGSAAYSFSRSAYEQNKDCICFGKQNPEQNYFLRRNKSYQLRIESGEQAHIRKQKLKSIISSQNGNTIKRSLKNDKIAFKIKNLSKNGINLTKNQSLNHVITQSPIAKQNKNIHLLQQYRESYPSIFSTVPKIIFKQNEPFNETKVAKALSWNHFKPLQQNQFYSPIKQNKNQYIEISNRQKPQINFKHQANITVNIGADTQKESKIKRQKQSIFNKQEIQITKTPSTTKFSNKLEKQCAVIKRQLPTEKNQKDCVMPNLQQSAIKKITKGESLVEKQIKLALSKQKRRQSIKYGQNIKNKKERGKPSLKKMDDALQCKSMNDEDQQRDDDNVSIVLDRLNQYSSYVEPLCEQNSSTSKLPSHNSTTFKSMLRNFSSKKAKEDQFNQQ